MTAPEPHAATSPTVHGWLDQWLASNGAELVATRRHLHAHPELGREEYQTTELVRRRLVAAGLSPQVLPAGTGLMCEVGAGQRGVALRADIDALPIQDVKQVAYRSTVDGVCHACGHDAHTAIMLGTALALAQAPPPGPPGRVRLVFQPAEELMPGGALDVVSAGGLEGVSAVFALHCDPRLDAGLVGVREGPITAAADMVQVRFSGPGGHTARPHLTADLIYAMGRVISDVPAVLSRLVDPRAALVLVWGNVQAGRAANAIPQSGLLRGTIRTFDRDAWLEAPKIVERLIQETVASSGVRADLDYVRGVPPVDNDPAATALLRAGATAALGAKSVVETQQSLGGEDFAWYLDYVPGALGRLGVNPHGARQVDLHQGGFDIDERAIAIGVRVLVHTAYAALGYTPSSRLGRERRSVT